MTANYSTDGKYELINRRRRQILVHSIIYYRHNTSIIDDATWTKWALELVELQKQYPEIAREAPYAEEFKNFDGSTGFDLPLDDPWGNNKAMYLMKINNIN